MESLINFFLDNYILFLLVSGFLILYYGSRFLYNLYKNKKKSQINVNNFNTDNANTENIDIFEQNKNSSFSYSEDNITSTGVDQNNDWKKKLREIEKQSEEIRNANTLKDMLDDSYGIEMGEEDDN